MALLPPQYLNTVVGLGSSKGQLMASGFLYGHQVGVDPADGRPWHRVFLVTNRHVADTEGIGALFNGPANRDRMFLSLPQIGADGQALWTLHPDDEDVAVCPISAPALDQAGIPYACFLSEDGYSCDQAQEAGVAEGSSVAVLGFPLGLSGENRHYTIVRTGSIARIRDWFDGDDERFMIDCPVFPGNSGGPVVTIPDSVSIQGTPKVQESRLLGVVCGYLPYEDVAVSAHSGDTRVVFQENSGLAPVLPVEMIEETVEEALC